MVNAGCSIANGQDVLNPTDRIRNMLEVEEGISASNKPRNSTVLSR